MEIVNDITLRSFRNSLLTQVFASRQTTFSVGIYSNNPNHFLRLQYTGSLERPQVIVIHDETILDLVTFKMIIAQPIIRLIIKIKEIPTTIDEIITQWNEFDTQMDTDFESIINGTKNIDDFLKESKDTLLIPDEEMDEIKANLPSKENFVEKWKSYFKKFTFESVHNLGEISSIKKTFLFYPNFEIKILTNIPRNFLNIKLDSIIQKGKPIEILIQQEDIGGNDKATFLVEAAQLTIKTWKDHTALSDILDAWNISNIEKKGFSLSSISGEINTFPLTDLKGSANISPVNLVHSYPIRNLPICYLPSTPLGKPTEIFILGTEKKEAVEYFLEDENGTRINLDSRTTTTHTDFSSLFNKIKESGSIGWKVFSDKSRPSLEKISNILDQYPFSIIEPQKIVQLSAPPVNNLEVSDFSYTIEGKSEPKRFTSYNKENKQLSLDESKDTKVDVSYLIEENLSVILSETSTIIELTKSPKNNLEVSDFNYTLKGESESKSFISYDKDNKQLSLNESKDTEVVVSYLIEENLSVIFGASTIFQLKGNLILGLRKENFTVKKSDDSPLIVVDYNSNKNQITINEAVNDKIKVSFTLPDILKQTFKDSWKRFVKISTPDILEDTTFFIVAKRKTFPPLKTYLKTAANYRTTFNSDLNISFKGHSNSILPLPGNLNPITIEIRQSLENFKYQVVLNPDDDNPVDLSNPILGLGKAGGSSNTQVLEIKIGKDKIPNNFNANGVIGIRIIKKSNSSSSTILKKRLTVYTPIDESVAITPDQETLDLPFDSVPNNIEITSPQIGITYQLWAFQFTPNFSFNQDQSDYTPKGNLKNTFDPLDNNLSAKLLYEFSEGGTPISGEAVLEEDSILMVKAINGNVESKWMKQYVARIKPNPSQDLEVVPFDNGIRVTIKNAQPGVGYQLREKNGSDIGVTQLTRANRLGWEAHERIFGMPIHPSNETLTDPMPGNYFKINDGLARNQRLEFILPLANGNPTTYEILAIKEYTGLEAILNKEIIVSNRIEIKEKSQT